MRPLLLSKHIPAFPRFFKSLKCAARYNVIPLMKGTLLFIMRADISF